VKPPAPRETVRAIGSATSGAVRHGWARWRRSMMLRVVASTAVVGLCSVAALGAYVSSHIRDGLVETKVDRILAESARDTADAQSKIDASPARTPGDLQKLVNDLVTDLHAIGGENRGVILLRQPGGTSQLFSQVSTTPGLQEVLTPEMRAAVQAGVAEQSYQHVYLESLQEPGVVVGAPLSSAVAGNFELYFVYSLVDEQKTLTLIQRILVIGGAALIALVLFMTWSVTLQAVRPVRQAARVASRLAEGLLSERMVVQGRDEMATLATTFNEMAESLQRQITRMEELSRLQRRFVSDVSHELRTPLTTVRMASDVLFDARADFGPDVARSAELLHTQLDRFEALLSDLLEISRIDAGAAQLEFEDVSLLDIAREELEAIAPVAASAGVQLRLWASPGEHEASMDRPRIARIVRNLLSNAIEYAQRGPIDVLVGSNRRGVAIMVRDYGQGMTAQQAERVFDRFWRGDAARTRTMGGTGLGLAIAREDALLHGGAIEAWGSPGHGASFRLSLPRTAQGLGQQPVVPLVAREREFARLGSPVRLGPPSPEVKP
jgi:two-component system sensor histidine kinase MtrB